MTGRQSSDEEADLFTTTSTQKNTKREMAISSVPPPTPSASWTLKSCMPEIEEGGVKINKPKSYNYTPLHKQLGDRKLGCPSIITVT